MKLKTIRLATLLIIILLEIPNITMAQANVKNKKKPEMKIGNDILLFNGKDLSNWVFKLKDPSIDPAAVFTIRNGVIHITGNPFMLNGAGRQKQEIVEFLFMHNNLILSG
jgi:hypothetical protein